MLTFKMLKRLEAITTKPYGVWVSEGAQPQKIIKLVKFNDLDLPEGTRLSQKGLAALTTQVSAWQVNGDDELNQTLNFIVNEWEEANEANFEQ
ncbi:hypothetical protein H8Q54_003782 [Vibrio parahaemolyticus]|uniref:hypothetical protein n=1 Tax=Vibrio parahaemolyticus TaxID=670 RepID=UPI001A1E3E32|nr:hypothetical protein [Vibrio parahaemolyticus]EGQ7872934.1 hypothetical protein [Vibrio parahaemolyticus]MCQ9041097.1 hypothetical protein [Vibrio parahaemolyticus]